MGCCYSTANDMLLGKYRQAYEMTPQGYDKHWGNVYMSPTISRQIRHSTIGRSAQHVKDLMELYPMLTYTIGTRQLAYDKKNYGPNHVRFCMTEGSDSVLLVIYG